LVSLLVAWGIAFIMASIAARSNRIGQATGMVIEVVAAAVPHFWLGAMLIIIFSTWLGWLPAVVTGTTIGMILLALTLALPLFMLLPIHSYRHDDLDYITRHHFGDTAVCFLVSNNA